MCGTLSTPPSRDGMSPGNRTTFPGKKPIPSWRPNSSLPEKSSCIPTQMPRNGLSEARYSRRNGSSPWRTTFPMQSRNAPTPGKTIPRQVESAFGSPLTRVGKPRDSRALLTLRRFPIP